MLSHLNSASPQVKNVVGGGGDGESVGAWVVLGGRSPSLHAPSEMVAPHCSHQHPSVPSHASGDCAGAPIHGPQSVQYLSSKHEEQPLDVRSHRASSRSPRLGPTNAPTSVLLVPCWGHRQTVAVPMQAAGVVLTR